MHMDVRNRVLPWALLALVVPLPAALAATSGDRAMTLDDVVRTREVTTAAISPSGERVAYTLSVPRDPYGEGDGPAWSELHVTAPGGTSRPYVTGEVDVSKVRWTPDGRGVSYMAKRWDDEHESLYIIPVDGGESRRALGHTEDLIEYSWSPDGKQVAFLAKAAENPGRKHRIERGFNARVYEEDWRPVKVWLARPGEAGDEPRALDLPGSARDLHWSPAGDSLAVALAPTPLIDDEYMRRRIHVVSVGEGKVLSTVQHEAKLGEIVWSPDGEHLAFLAGEDVHDPSPGRLMAAPARGGTPRDLLPGFLGQVEDLAWRDEDTLVFVGHEGTLAMLGSVDLDGSNRRTLVPAGTPILRAVSIAADGEAFAFVADAPEHPREVWTLSPTDASPVRTTDVNPWLAQVRLGRQEVVRYAARDGLEIEGVLVRPIETEEGLRLPLVLSVHGGPEAHRSNGWLSRYSSPAHVLAANGYAVFFPNYRGSTGRGVSFSKLGQADCGGGEFDDLVDAIAHLDGIGLVNPAKVGITGGSYGGFAAAWGATKLTEHFAASVMFVGISDHVSKAGTTDIPNEMYQVHSRRRPWRHWDWFRERSPLYWVEQARTPLLILHGEKDTRVDPSQSLELYRYLEQIGKVPVRLILYPDEGHGNRRAAARLDYAMRLLRWMDHYLQGPGGTPPPFELTLEAARLDGNGD